MKIGNTKFELENYHSPYVYCHNDPVNFVDPDGEKTTLPPVKVAEAISYFVSSTTEKYPEIYSGDLQDERIVFEAAMDINSKIIFSEKHSKVLPEFKKKNKIF